jgi:hypothetical protein
MKVAASDKIFGFVMIKIILIFIMIASTFCLRAQNRSEQKISIGAIYEQNIILKQYLSIGHLFHEVRDDAYGNGFGFCPSLRRKSNLPDNFRLFSYTIGGKIDLHIYRGLSMNTGLCLLFNEAYQPYYSNGSAHISATYRLDATSAKYLRFPLGFSVISNKNNPDSIVNFTIGAGVSFDFLFNEEIYYNFSKSMYLESNKFLFERIVPYINSGSKIPINSNLEISCLFSFYFRSAYQNAHREFYFKNSSLGIQICLLYKFKKKDHESYY